MILKPQSLNMFEVEVSFMDELDIEMLINCLHQGMFVGSSYRLAKYRKDYYNKSCYDFFPKAFKYRTSEFNFNFYNFSWDDFYDFRTDPILVKIDYCKYILKTYSNAKKTLKLYNKLKIEYPEYFI